MNLLPEIVVPQHKLTTNDMQRAKHMMSTEVSFDLTEIRDNREVPETVCKKTLAQVMRGCEPPMNFDGEDTKAGYSRKDLIEYAYSASIEELQLRSIKALIQYGMVNGKTSEKLNQARHFLEWVGEKFYGDMAPILPQNLSDYLDKDELEFYNKYLKGYYSGWIPSCLFHGTYVRGYLEDLFAGGLARATFIARKSRIKGFADYCVAVGIMNSNNIGYIESVKPRTYFNDKVKEKKEARTILDNQNLTKVSKAIMETTEPLQGLKVVCYLWLTRHMVARPSELIRMKVSEIKAKRLLWQEKVMRNKRVDEISGDALRVLDKWLELHAKECERSGVDNEYLFPSSVNHKGYFKQSHVQSGWLKYVFKRLRNTDEGKALGFSPTAYDLRKAAVTIMSRKDGGIHTAQRKADHLSVSTTKTFYDMEHEERATKEITSILEKIR